jgi:hypothetical protein
MFRRLDRKLTDTIHLTQSLVSAVSILLTSIFKAALTASTGICFAQHLWFILRGNAMSLSAIEKLFVFRTNILVLGDLRSILRAPLLFLMALLIWCLGIATIYPPGALIVTFEAHTSTKPHNMSVMNPPVPHDLKFFDDNVTFPTLGFHPEFNYQEYVVVESAKYFRYPYVAPLTLHTLLKTKPCRDTSGRLLNIARLIIMNGQVLDLLVYPGENSTFNLQFRAPQFHCNSSTYNHTQPLEDSLGGSGITPIFESEWHSPSSDNHIFKYTLRKHSVKYLTIKRRPDNLIPPEAQLETFEQSCWPISMLYNVTISFPRGVRKIEHTLSNARAVPDPKDIYDHRLPYFDDGGNNSIYLALPAEPKAQEEWNQKVLTALPVVNEWLLLDALGSLLAGEASRMLSATDCQQREVWENGTSVEDCAVAELVGRMGTRKSLSYFSSYDWKY